MTISMCTSFESLEFGILQHNSSQVGKIGIMICLFSFYYSAHDHQPGYHKVCYLGAVVVAQLVERSLPIPEVRGSNPVIGKSLN